MLFNKKYCFKNLSFFSPTPHEKIVIRTESWVKNRDTNRIVGLVYRYSPTIYIFIDVFKAKIYMQFHVQVHRDRDGCKRILFALFYKSTMFRCYYECTQI